MEKKTLFEIRKEVPFVFKIGFTVQEEAMPIEYQRENINKGTMKMKDSVKRMKEEFVRIPFEVMDVPSLIGAIQDIGFDHFVDP